jgi:chromosome segregation ATPase
MQENEKVKSQVQVLKEDLKALKAQTDQQSLENKRNQSRLQETSFENSSLLSRFQNLTKEKEDQAYRLASVKKEIEDLNSQYLHLSSEKDQLHSQYSQVSREKDQISRALSETQSRLGQVQKEKDDIIHKLSLTSKESQDLSTHLSTVMQEKDQVIKSLQNSLNSLETEIISLKSELESNSCEIQELHMVIDHARQEKAQISSVLSDEISIKSSEMQKWVAQSNMKDKEITFIKQILNDREAEVLRNQETLKSLIEETSLAKRQMEEIRHDKENLHLRMNEKEFLLNSIKESAGSWECKYSECMKENDSLRAQVSDLEAKNRQLFDNLDRELAQRAKDYKERTMNILSQPIRASSPGLRPPTPDGRYYSRLQTPMMSVDKQNDEYSGNTAARLLSTLEASPKSRSVVRTPTKEDLKAKIANLLENRSRIENELRGLDED